MTADGERDGPGEGSSSGERESVPEFVQPAPIGDDADAATIDEEFDKIIAEWDRPGSDSDVGPWPAAEGLPPVGLPPAGLPPAGHAPTLPRATPAVGDDLGHRVIREPRDAPLPQRPQIWRGFPPPQEYAGGNKAPDVPDKGLPDHVLDALDEGYDAPEPPPLGGDLVSRMSWAAVLGGPLFLVFAVLFWQNLPQLLILAALAAFVGGFIALVARMPGDRDPDDDDGAVV